MIRVTGRVMAVDAVEDGSSFRVTIGPAPRVFVFRVTRRPPKLGERVLVEGEIRTSRPLGRDGMITLLDPRSVERLEAARRIVDPTWIERVQRTMARPLLPFQVEGAAWLASRIMLRRGALLGDDMGLGKTAQAIAAVCAVNAMPAIVVCPAIAKGQWYDEFQHVREPPEVCVVDGREGALPPAHVFILNYAVLKHRREQLASLRPRLYVFDEAQHLKNPKARGHHRAALATKLVRPTGGAVLLTGTPVMNRPSELWRLLHLVDPETWFSYDVYAERYCQPTRGREIGRTLRTDAGRIERLDELHAAVAPVMLRRLKADVLSELPPKKRRTALVRLSSDDMAHYRRAEKDVAAWLHAMGQSQRAMQAARSPALTRLTYLRRIAALGKLRGPVPGYLARWQQQYGREPLVIFGYHRDVMLALWNISYKLGLRVTGVGGREAPERRRRNIAAFQSGQADVFLAPIAVAGTGLNLQRACHALFVERIWTPSGLAQAEDRIHRLGQERPVTITYIDAAGTVDEHIAHVVEEKQRLIDAVVDDRTHASESLDTVQEVMARLASA